METGLNCLSALKMAAEPIEKSLFMSGRCRVLLEFTIKICLNNLAGKR